MFINHYAEETTRILPFYKVSIFHGKKIKRQYFSSIENFPSDIRLLKREGKAAATPFAILFIVIRQFYWSSQGQPLKEFRDFGC